MKKKQKFKFNKPEIHSQRMETKQPELAFHSNPAPIKPEDAINYEPPQPTGYTAMATLKEIDAQLAALKAQREEVRKSEHKGAVEKVRALVAQYELTQADVFAPSKGRSATAGSKVAPKYRDPATGETWTGRGKAPKWIEGQEREKFAI